MHVSDIINHDIHCECGKIHRCDIPYLNIGKGVLSSLPEMLTNYSHILLVADNNTYTLCGDRVKNMLGTKLDAVSVLEAEGFLVPDKPAVEEVAKKLTANTDFVLGIGSGVLNDICKYVAFTHDLPCGIVATAPSMDGYASSGAAMIFDGMKITFTMRAPVLILGDTEILKDAPMDMIRSGYADIIGKYSALNDWKLSHLVNGEHLCPFLYNIVMDCTNEMRAMASRIAARDEEAIGRLMEILVLVGVAMTLNNSTRPGSGSEHHLSHFYEITGLIEDKPYFLHGIDVGYATTVVAGLREKLRNIEKPQFRTYTDEERMQAYQRIFKSEWKSVWDLQEKAGFYKKDPAKLYADKWEQICEILRECPTAQEITTMLTDVGFDMDAFEKMYGKQKIADSALYGKDLKDRFSVLWLYAVCQGVNGF